MKTSIKYTAFLFLLATSVTSCLSDKTRGNKIVTSQSRNVTEPFTKISAQQGLSVYITMSSEEKITVETDENLQDIIKTEIKNGTLKIYSIKKISKSEAKNVYVSILKISEIESNSGARVFAENTLISKSMTVKSSSGSSIDLQVSTDSLFSSSSSGSSLKLKGQTLYHSAKSSSGSSINSYHLKAKNVDTKANSGSHIRVTATDTLNAKANSGGSIQYKGNPNNIDRNISSGGNISVE